MTQKLIKSIYSLILAMNQKNRAVSKAYDSELTVAESAITTELFSNSNITPSELCTKLMLDKFTLSRHLANLKQKKLILEKTSESDKRSKALSLTKLGISKFKDTYKRECLVFKSALKRLNAKEQERIIYLSSKYLKGYENLNIAKLKDDPPLLYHVRVVSRALGLISGNLFGQSKYTVSEWHILSILYYSFEPINATILAQKLALSATTIASSLKKLFKEKIIVKTNDLNSQKKIVIELTAKGKKEYLNLENHALNFLTELYSSLSKTELEEFTILFTLYSGSLGVCNEIYFSESLNLKLISQSEDKNQYRAFIYRERVKQNLLENLPVSCLADDSICFAVHDASGIMAVYEVSRDKNQNIQRILYSKFRNARQIGRIVCLLSRGTN